MAREKVEMRTVPSYDPFVAHEIFAFNGEYDGDVNGVRFIAGKGVLDALSKDADEDALVEWEEKLMWFWNSEPATKYVVDDRGRGSRKTFPGYTIEPKGKTAKEKVPA